MLRYGLEYNVPRVEKSISQYIGKLGEKLALKYLIENRFEVISFSYCLIVSLGYSKKEQEDFLNAIKNAQMPREIIVVSRDLSLRLNKFLTRLPKEYKVFPQPSESSYIFVLNKSGQSTLIYTWKTIRPVTTRKTTRLMNKSYYKRMKIDNKVLLARRFSRRTKELAKEVKNLVLVEAEPSKRQAQVEGEIDDNHLVSLLLKALEISEREWQEKLKRRHERAKELTTRNEEALRYAKKRLEESEKIEKAVKRLFGERWNNFLRFCEAWEEEPDVPSGKRFHPVGHPQEDFVTRSIDWGFDYVAKKDSRNYFVEVKTNKARLRKYQKKMMMKAKEFGFIPMIVRPKVSIVAELEDVATETF